MLNYVVLLGQRLPIGLDIVHPVLLDFFLHAVVATSFFAVLFLHHLLVIDSGLGFSRYFGGVVVSCLGNVLLFGFIYSEFELATT